ncbi:ubiquitin carboxyl-terminal hydrolase MINDY-3 homolog isoform X1 [Hylaeus volcanicus]|uniref:ubiquitin carboxyl-terminal hydrolase MINDY-3 homolog isoform X1 n=1 Tax=Hylaeus volcanicus TaxID=313075 RepID=UPI0023B78A17|nr:ubiquitin carboxyl-terminal hydrolase MINDY-3 homolog isoform X1 [Hylaeus volcanicus]
MAENAVQCDDEFLHSIKTLLWGNAVKEDVFKRWAQGFYFSPDEPTALIQAEGGPCAVIAPVQAFILKQLLSETDISTWRSINLDKCYQLLVRASVEILKQAAGEKGPKYSVIYMECKVPNETSEEEPRWSKKVSKKGSEEEEANADNQEVINTRDKTLAKEINEDLKSIHPDVFHSQLRLFTTNISEHVEEFLSERLEMLKDRYGVLLLLYSVIVTKGITEIHVEMSDPLEAMIDATYGYGSQSLINLILTGRAVSHVWDYDQTIGDLKLRGIDKQNSVGFLALLEHLRYFEVGTFLKSPSNPVWVLGSDTHLSVLFSSEKRLVSPETPAEQAKRVFRKFDHEGNNFIPANLLQDVLAELGLVADAEYVDIMRKKLDSENLGIILRSSFMDEFFPEETRTCPDIFPLYHYNGLQRSNYENKVIYRKGQAVLLECTIKGILESNPMLTVLQTKWPRIEVQWDGEQTPSLN